MRTYEKVLLLVSLLTALEVVWSMGEPGEVMVPGSPSNVSKNDKGLAKAVLVATYSFNNQSNDAYLFRTSEVEKAQRQIVKGIRYILEVRISRTVCLKRLGRDLLDCELQPEGRLHQMFQCHFVVLSLPWLDMMTTTSIRCQH
ncbi:cystatin [Gadus chalcogrammus]|uniref:cystatin n=1 Tax=Gadus chalcogrammus TaxID=1042646 RepID=UPI0024C49090|nr:cystatin [Gadus chalcogrammus]